MMIRSEAEAIKDLHQPLNSGCEGEYYFGVDGKYFLGGQKNS
jgi:hypothetical protein